MNVHRLNGCAPTPLASYLKALGILRLVSEQLDPSARGFWEGERFALATSKDARDLIEFFLERYAPTPLVSPWNKGSGFFAGDRALAPAEESTAARFEGLRRGIDAARLHLEALEAADSRVREVKALAKDKTLSKAQRDGLRKSEDYKRRLAEAERSFKSMKADLLPTLRRAWRGPHREWMDAAMVLDADGTARFPALLGTGGNDGRLDFANNFFQRLSDLFDLTSVDGEPRVQSRLWFEESLWGAPARVMEAGAPVGQFAPGGAGGANTSFGAGGDSRMNPADFILMLEGAVLFASAASRRWDAQSPARASAPFAVSGVAAAYCSAAASEDSSRGEQWMPLWSSPATLNELKRLLAEGRAQIGARAARAPLDMARAVARLGTARGISAFQRFGYIERNGQSKLAVPLGRFVVPAKSSPRLACLDDLNAWLPRLGRQARGQQAPARLVQVERRLADALFAVTQHPDESIRWQTVLQCLAEVEAVQVTGSGYQAGPIPRLRPEWVEAADDRSPELRLAVAFALQAGAFDRHRIPIGDSGMRRHWVTLTRARYATSGVGGQQRLQPGVDRVMRGRSGLEDAIAVVTRRSIEAALRGGSDGLSAARAAFAARADLATVVAGAIDLDRTLAIARALMAIDARAWASRPAAPCAAPRGDLPDDGWLAIRLTLLPWPLPDGRCITGDPAIVRRLATGDAPGAVSIALRRLRAAGIRPTLRSASVSPDTARRWAAALAFPITQTTAAAFVARLDPSSLKETAA